MAESELDKMWRKLDPDQREEFAVRELAKLLGGKMGKKEKEPDWESRQVVKAIKDYGIKPEEVAKFYELLQVEKANTDRKAQRNGYPAERAARKLRGEASAEKFYSKLPADWDKSHPGVAREAIQFWTETRFPETTKEEK